MGKYSRSVSRSRSRGRGNDREEQEEGYRVHIADLGVDCAQKELEKSFGKFGEYKELWLARNPPCFAFCVYNHRADAEEAIKEMDGRVVCNSRVRVSWARPRTRGRNAQFDPNMRCYQCGQRGHFSRDCNRSGRNRNYDDRGSRRSGRRSRSRSRSRGNGRYRRRSRSYSRSRSNSPSRKENKNGDAQIEKSRKRSRTRSRSRSLRDRRRRNHRSRSNDRHSKRSRSRSRSNRRNRNRSRSNRKSKSVTPVLKQDEEMKENVNGIEVRERSNSRSLSRDGNRIQRHSDDEHSGNESIKNGNDLKRKSEDDERYDPIKTYDEDSQKSNQNGGDDDELSNHDNDNIVNAGYHSNSNNEDED